MTHKFRIALRTEGKWWVGYYCQSMTSMAEAIPIARVRLSLITPDNPTKQAFIDFCNLLVSEKLKDITDGKIDIRQFDIQTAPEHEKAGNA